MSRWSPISVLMVALLLAVAPMPAQSSRGDKIEGLIARGWALSANGRFAEALAPLDQALALEADNPNALTLKGGALVGLKRPQEALVCLEKALAQRKQDPLALAYEGQALYGLGRFSESVTCFERALTLDPKQFTAKAGLRWSAQKAATATAAPGPGVAPGTGSIKTSRFGGVLGDTLTVKEVAGGSVYDGTWTRRAGTDIFDAVWNGSIRDVIEIESFNGNQIVFYRHGNKGRYTGRLSADGTQVTSGTANWYSAGWFWSAKVSGPVHPPNDAIKNRK